MAESQQNLNELLAKAAQYRNAAKKALEEETKEIMKQKKISEELARVEARKSDAYKDQAKALKEVVAQVKEIQSNTKIVVDDLIRQESSLKGLTGMYTNLGKLD